MIAAGLLFCGVHVPAVGSCIIHLCLFMFLLLFTIFVCAKEKKGGSKAAPFQAAATQTGTKNQMTRSAETEEQKAKVGGGGTAESAVATKSTGKKNAESGGATALTAGEKAKSPERVLKPRIFKLGKKELEIAKGEKRRRGEYPTFDDVKSDWDSNTDKDEGDKTKSNVETKLEESEQGDDKAKDAKEKDKMPHAAINKDDYARKQSEQKKPSAPPAGAEKEADKKKESSKKSTPEVKADDKKEEKAKK